MGRTSPTDPKDLPDRIRAVLACSECQAPLPSDLTAARCSRCGGATSFRDGVLVARTEEAHSYFDNVFEVMREGNHVRGTWDIFYQEQAAVVEQSLREGEIVLDVGCGPELPYNKRGAFVIGVDASFNSIRVNQHLDLRIFASATRLPLAAQSIDCIVCFYSIHHMTGSTIDDNLSIVRDVFREFARVLKSAGRIMIFDMSPRWPFASIENSFWNVARQRLGDSLDMFFWKDRTLEAVATEAFPQAEFSQRSFNSSPLKTFPPIFSKPSLRVPRLLYPFDINIYQWRLGN
jgi:ubiquinone/menaquinone biosynthesis C-methylase UbiE